MVGDYIFQAFLSSYKIHKWTNSIKNLRIFQLKLEKIYTQRDSEYLINLPC